MEKNPLYSAPVIQKKEGAIVTEEKKSTYAGFTEARKKANEKYLKETVEDIRIRVPKGQKVVIKNHSDKMGESMNAFVVRAINDAMERDNQK